MLKLLIEVLPTDNHYIDDSRNSLWLRRLALTEVKGANKMGDTGDG